MRLLHVSTRELREFSSSPPAYAILSHTWGKEEVTFEDLKTPDYTSKLGYKKIDGCCKQAHLDGFEWVWIDTCCIDKSSSAELSETINSMFAWYKKSSMCYIYLEDVPPADPSDHRKQGTAFRSSRWFTRGWTLQELLASEDRQIFDSTWQRIDLDSDYLLGFYPSFRGEVELLSEITGIPKDCLWNNSSDLWNARTPLSEFSVSTRMTWASRRSTTREEDMAYCLLGIFEVNMPLLYGEGRHAFIRLQEEILRKTPDETIFCWDWGCFHGDSMGNPTGALALSPAEFTNGGDLLDGRSTSNFESRVSQRYESDQRLAFHITLTNQGILIELPLYFIDDVNGLALAVLNVYTNKDRWRVALPLVRANRLYSNIFKKAPGSTPFTLPEDYSAPSSIERIYIQHLAMENWEISPRLDSDHMINWSLNLGGDTWRVEGWNCHGWYPPVPLVVNTAAQCYNSVSNSLPPQFLAIFGNQTCSILYFLVTTKTEGSFEVKVGLTIVMAPALTPLDVLYSATTQKVEISQLERFKWTILDGESTLSVGQRTVRGVVNLENKGGFFLAAILNVELRLT